MIDNDLDALFGVIILVIDVLWCCLVAWRQSVGRPCPPWLLRQISKARQRSDRHMIVRALVLLARLMRAACRHPGLPWALLPWIVVLLSLHV